MELRGIIALTTVQLPPEPHEAFRQGGIEKFVRASLILKGAGNTPLNAVFSM